VKTISVLPVPGGRTAEDKALLSAMPVGVFKLINYGSVYSGFASASAGVGPGGRCTVSSSGTRGKGSRDLSGSLPAQLNISTGDRYSEGQRAYNREEGTVYRDVNRSQADKKSQEKATSDAQRKIDLDALGRSIRDGISYALRTGSFKEVGETISRALQYAQERLESYRQSLQTARSVGFEKSLFPAVFNQLKQEEA
jgi:hypothetical protein